MSAPATEETAMRGEGENGRSGRPRLVHLLAVGVATALLAGALPAMASATDFCVKPDTSCGPNSPNNVDYLEQALDRADNDNDADRIFLGATEYTAPTTNGYSYAALNAPVEIIGQGQGQTTLTSQPGGRVLALAGGAGTSVHDLTIKLPESAAAGTFGLLTYNAARRVEVVEDSTQANYRYGAILQNGGTLEDSTITLAGEQHAAGVFFQTGDGSVRRSAVSAGTGVLSYGGSIERSRVTGSQYGVRAFNGPTAISSSLIRLAGSYGSGLRLETAASPNATMTADGVTIVAPVSPDVVGAGVSTANNPAGNATLSLTNSVIRGSNPLFVRRTGAGTAKVVASYSDYDPSENVALGTEAKIEEANVSNTGDAGFVNPAGGDYRLLPGSPLVDAGDPAAPQGVDLAGSPLVADGNGDGSARRDIGAFELQPAAPGGAGQPGGTAADTQAPFVTGFRAAPSLFAVGPVATPVAARLPRGTRFRYTLSEPSRVAVAIQRALPGRRQSGRCVRPSQRLRHAKRCTRYRTVGTLLRSGKSGVNSTPFTGTIGKRALARGSYRAVIRATDLAGNRSRPQAARFRVAAR